MDEGGEVLGGDAEAKIGAASLSLGEASATDITDKLIETPAAQEAMTEDNRGECLAEVDNESAMVAEVVGEERPAVIAAEQEMEAESEPTSGPIVVPLDVASSSRVASVNFTMVDAGAEKPNRFEEEYPTETATEEAIMTGLEPAAIVPYNPIVEPSDVASSSGVALDDVMINEEDTTCGPFTRPYATTLQVLMEQFLGHARAVMPLMLQNR